MGRSRFFRFDFAEDSGVMFLDRFAASWCPGPLLRLELQFPAYPVTEFLRPIVEDFASRSVGIDEFFRFGFRVDFRSGCFGPFPQFVCQNKIGGWGGWVCVAPPGPATP